MISFPNRPKLPRHSLRLFRLCSRDPPVTPALSPYESWSCEPAQYPQYPCARFSSTPPDFVLNTCIHAGSAGIPVPSAQKIRFNPELRDMFPASLLIIACALLFELLIPPRQSASPSCPRACTPYRRTFALSCAEYHHSSRLVVNSVVYAQPSPYHIIGRATARHRTNNKGKD